MKHLAIIFALVLSASAASAHDFPSCDELAEHLSLRIEHSVRWSFCERRGLEKKNTQHKTRCPLVFDQGAGHYRDCTGRPLRKP